MRPLVLALSTLLSVTGATAQNAPPGLRFDRLSLRPTQQSVVIEWSLPLGSPPVLHTFRTEFGCADRKPATTVALTPVGADPAGLAAVTAAKILQTHASALTLSGSRYSCRDGVMFAAPISDVQGVTNFWSETPGMAEVHHVPVYTEVRPDGTVRSVTLTIPIVMRPRPLTARMTLQEAATFHLVGPTLHRDEGLPPFTTYYHDPQANTLTPVPNEGGASSSRGMDVLLSGDVFFYTTVDATREEGWFRTGTDENGAVFTAPAKKPAGARVVR